MNEYNIAGLRMTTHVLPCPEMPAYSEQSGSQLRLMEDPKANKSSERQTQNSEQGHQPNRIEDEDEGLELAVPGMPFVAPDPELTGQKPVRPPVRPQEPVEPAPKDHPSSPTEKLQPLTSKQVSDITERMSASNSTLSARDKKLLLSNLEQNDTSSQKIIEAKKSTPAIAANKGAATPATPATPTRAKSEKNSNSPNSARPLKREGQLAGPGPVRGVALFDGSMIKLTAPAAMKNGERLTIGEHQYELRKSSSKIGRSFLTHGLIVAGVGALALSVASILSAPSEEGSIAGIALDEAGIPYHTGAIVKIPELDKAVETDMHGLFRFDDIAPGSYAIEYSLSGNRSGKTSIRVLKNQTALITLSGATVLPTPQSTTRAARSNSGRPGGDTQNSSQPTKTTSLTKSATKSRGSLAVTSDITGAVVYVGKQKLGEVNRTFRRMITGVRNIRIVKPGYVTYSGKIEIKKGKIARVNVTLAPDGAQAPQERILSPSERFETARELVRNGQNDQALENLNLVLSEDPSMADAYYLRGEILSENLNTPEASRDYLKAAEIWAMQRRDRDALSSFDLATKANTSLAFKSRGDFYRHREMFKEAISDYEAALELDGRYYPARLGLGITLFEDGSHRQAHKQLRRAMDDNPNDPLLYQYLMINALAKNDIGDVSRYFKQFRRFASDSEISRMKSDPKFAAVNRIVRD